MFPITINFSESKIIAIDGNCSVSALINSQGMYDYNNMMLLTSVLADGGVFVDVGANVGSYSLLASENSRATVHAFEPHPETFERLRKNILLNSRANAIVVNAAVGRRNETVSITDTPGSSLTYVTRTGGAETISVECVTLDGYCAREGLIPKVVKVDVEGYEDEVLSGMNHTLTKIEVLIVETRFPIADDLGHALQQAGLVGPFSCDFDRLALDAYEGAGEDPVYVRRTALSGESWRGWKVTVSA